MCATATWQPLHHCKPPALLQVDPGATPAGQGSADQPLIVLGTPQAERASGSLQDSAGRPRGADPFELCAPPTSGKKRRLSLASAINDLTGKLLQDDCSDLLLDAAQVPLSVKQTLCKSVVSSTCCQMRAERTPASAPSLIRSAASELCS